ncbi:MAG: flagellar basal body rod protein FlgB [Bdellovibrionales bacterium]|nr:flagellar basal body rod protein FlgB [Bdellovibrionales bacterium]NQZ19271.1 flagellar basal body rod protein FlgB [Bdellovibrionales bacterium]
MGQIFDKTIKALNTSLQMRQLKQNVISANVANAETPGYRAKKMDFEAALASAIDREDLGKMHVEHGDHFLMGQGAIGRVRADIYDNPEINYSNDGNTVDMEKEMAALNENSLMYDAATKLINKKLAALKYAASDGGR